MPLNLKPQLESVIPGFSNNTKSASSLVKNLMAGKLTPEERSSIYSAGAERATLGGMPGASGSGGSLFANADLRNIGRASGERQQQGFQDFLAMLQGFSGSVVPTTGQEYQNQQFGTEMNFRNKQADRNFGLQQNEQDLAAATFNERYGPKETSSSRRVGPNGSYVYDSPPVFQTPGGRTAGTSQALMFKYRR